MHNVNTKTKLGDNHRQMRSQHKDFGDIVNTNTDLNVTEERYCRIFHNWDNPEQCARRNSKPICWVCNEFKEGRPVERTMDDDSIKIYEPPENF